MPAHVDDDLRFAAKVQRDPATGCLLWTQGTAPGGYGVFSVRHKTVRANRWALERKLGRPLRPGMKALHTCDTPACCEPDHLYEGTHARNMQDALDRGRTARGERIGTSKLTGEQVAAIRRLGGRRDLTQRAIATLFGIDQSQVSRIMAGKRWGGESVAGA